MTRNKPRVFISYSSQDKSFVDKLYDDLRPFKIFVWYDRWEIAVGDSIVDKISEGLETSVTLIIVLSQASVSSRWVKEELNTIIMRRMSDSDIRILPVLIESCEIPSLLKHIRYADFRDSYEEGLANLFDAIFPEQTIRQSLAHHYDHFCLLCEQLVNSELDADADENVFKLHSILETVLNLRTEIELRRANQKAINLDFFEKIGLLVERGIDVRSQTWNALVRFRSMLAHQSIHDLRVFAVMLEDRYHKEDLHESLKAGLERLKQIMRLICFEKWEYDRVNKGE